MHSMPLPNGPDALAARITALEAERLAPVPRASHAIGIDVDDLALAVSYIADAAGAARRGRVPAMDAATAVAWQKLDTAVRSHARAAA